MSGSKPSFSFFVHISKFSSVISFADYERNKLLSDVIKHMLMKNFHKHSLNLLNFVCVRVFDVEAVLDKTKLVIP